MKVNAYTSAVLLSMGLLSACTMSDQRKVMGQTGMLFGAPASSWARLDAQGTVQEVGVTVAMKGVESAPVPAANAKPPTEAEAMAAMMSGPTLRLEFPAIVKATTFLDHADFFWEPYGHPPGRYLTPHFDAHFFGVSSATVDKIDCKNLTPPAMALTPPGYAPAVPPGVDPATMCVPLMGFHGVPLSEFKAPGVLQSGLFDHVLISGFYDNQYIFTEPMVTKAFMLTKQGFTADVARPAQVGRATLYPTKFALRFDERANTYEFVYSGFQPGM